MALPTPEFMASADFAEIEKRMLAYLTQKEIPMPAHVFKTKDKKQLANALRRDAQRTNPPYNSWAHINPPSIYRDYSLNDLPSQYRTRYLLLQLANWCAGAFLAKEPLWDIYDNLKALKLMLRHHANPFAGLAYHNVADAMELYRLEEIPCKRIAWYDHPWHKQAYHNDTWFKDLYMQKPKPDHKKVEWPKGTVTGRWTSTMAGQKPNPRVMQRSGANQYTDEKGRLRELRYEIEDGVFIVTDDFDVKQRDEEETQRWYYEALVAYGAGDAKIAEACKETTFDPDSNTDKAAKRDVWPVVKIEKSDLNQDQDGNFYMDLDTIHDLAKENPL